ncbi:glycosyltransferase [Protaetiibacter intestinalis]|uniref:Glycosyltransferase n=1 Tax=Protaetiibacter intestinalis TaxID=2419774 RepID=A0A387BBM5_9MICO|nr:glycosyltransferase [Protaetiibacter intestinalis]AYF98349.1 glycosyltransferase [Protaetiibacter intestinalis]
MPQVRPGLVSVVLVNYRGTDDTLAAIDALGKLDWPAERLEIIVVENASGDDSLKRLRAEASEVTIVPSKTNLGFAGGCNLGVSRSSGEVVAFLNNDARPDENWIGAAMEAFDRSPRVGAVASRVLDWDGKLVDFVDAALTWYGMGYKPLTGDRPPSRGDQAHPVLFGTGAAMFVRREVYEELGGFDERYFMFFEDVDFGWRLNLAGWRFSYEPASLAFHRHHASMKDFGSYREQYLLERNALFTLYKNLESEALNRVLPAAMALAVRRSVAKAGVDSASLDLRAAVSDETDHVSVSRQLLPGVFAIDQFVKELTELAADRERIQEGRRVSDAKLWALFGMTDVPAFTDDYYLDGYENIVQTFDVLSEPARSRVLIITGDPIGPKLAGPAIRAWNMAEILAEDAEVRLLTLQGAAHIEAPFEIVHVAPGNEKAFALHEAWAEVIVFQGHAMAVFDTLRRSSKILVVDVYDPMHLEQLEQARELGSAAWEKQVSDATEVLNEQLERGDFFLCASERQRHFYLGQLAGLGRVNPSTYRGDPDLTGLIAVAPFGLSATPPVHERDVLRGVLPGITADDKVLIWSGGLYNWFDPETLIRAVADLEERRGRVRLFFQGTKHPHPGVPEMEIVERSRRLAGELDVLDRAVFFNDSWVEYADRQNYLLEADAGVSTHFAHVETTFSFRTRILDYLWAGLPMVVTDGDHFAGLVRERELGIVVPAGDVEALSAALEKVLFDDAFRDRVRENVARVREDYVWERTLLPLVDFIREPRRAADRSVVLPRRKSARRRRRSGLGHDVRQALHYLRHGGPRVVAEKVSRRLRRS